MEVDLDSGQVCLETVEDKVLISQDIKQKKGDDFKQKGFDLNDEPFISSLKEVEVEREERIEECGKDGELGNQEVVELNENVNKMRRLEGSEGNKVDDTLNNKVKEEGLKGKVQFSGRVLRSRSAVKNVSEKGVDKGETSDDKIGGSSGCGKKTVQVVQEDDDHSHCEVKSQPGTKFGEGDDTELGLVDYGLSNHFDDDMLRNKVKRKRGRPPKLQADNEYQKKAAELQVGEKVFKRKRGRPPKFQRTNGLEKKDGEAGKELKRKRGRPPKLLGESRFEKAVEMEAQEADLFDGDLRKESKLLGNDGLEKTVVKIEAVQGDQSNGKGSKESKHNHSDTETWKEARHKHGRPMRMDRNNGFEMKTVKVEMGEGDQFNSDLRKEGKKKRGRPPKQRGCDGLEKKFVKSEKGRNDHRNSKVRKGKRGRPPKVQVCQDALKGKFIDERKKLGGLRRGRKKLGSKYSEKILIGEESNSNMFFSANKVRFEDTQKNDSKAEVVSVKGKKMKVQKAGDAGQTDDVDQRRSEAKQALRDRIVKLLKAAGWTIEYRPRNNKAYNDAVYVNPEGRTHWSVTLAYRMLKRDYESDDCNSKVSPNGFIFTPIPEEELRMLKRVVLKKRRQKKSQQEDDDDDDDDDLLNDREVERKINKRKKKWKGNSDNEYGKKKKKQKLLKEKIMHHEGNISDGTLPKGTLLSGRKCTLQQKQKGKRGALLVRNSIDGAETDNGGYVLYDGKRTVLAWMIDLGAVQLDGKVEYLSQRRTRATRVVKSGRITRDGIQCNCCSDVFTVAEFESHAGSKLNLPFQNICLETGTSLLQCLLDAWNKQQSECTGFHHVDFSEDPNDDTCGICGDGGDLICCDSCPSTFHQSCLDIKAFPSGKWDCVYCTCKYCGMVGDAYQSDKDEAVDPAVLTCLLCEEKYHRSCIQTVDAFDDDLKTTSFCGKKCKVLFEKLWMLVGVKHELQEGFSWTLLHRFDIGSDVCLNEGYKKIESNSKLAVALTLMDECFLPLADHRTGINLIHNIVYNFGSNFTRLNYSGFFTAILERGDEVISAASIRIHGNQLAEMPFIGTRYAHRRQGMCRRLLFAVESGLSSLNVQKLVIPAISELRETWTSVFGFQPVDAASKQKMRNMNMLVFPGVDMLQKSLFKHDIDEQRMDDGPKTGQKRSVVFDLNVSAENPLPQSDEENGKPAAGELLLLDDTLKYTSDLMDKANNLPESANISCACSPTSEVKIDVSSVKQNLEDSVKRSSDDIIPADAENEVAVPVAVNASKVAVVNNGFNCTHQVFGDAKDIKQHEKLELEAVRCVSEEVKNHHAIAKDVLANQISSANGHCDASYSDGKSSVSCQCNRVGASGNVSTFDVNSHPGCDESAHNSEKQNL